ncbi:MAG: tetratricopeptide repeat protein [Chitinophagaceae bacterium]|nr:tetratricopeptide repeat protein [Chitinophagaceae bacterium]
MKNVLCCFLVISLVFAGCTDDKERDSVGNSALLKSPPFLAITDSIREFPDNPRHYLARALLLSQNNLHDAATPDYQKAWELSKDEAIALEYASNLQLVNKTTEAIEFIKARQQDFPNNQEFGRRLSEVYAATGKRKEALEEYDKLILSDSLNFMAWYERGVLLARLRDTTEAIISLEKSYAIQPINYTGLALAQIYSMQQNPRLLTICDDILHRDSTGEVIDALFIKGTYYADTKEYTKALPIFEECIKLDWKFLDAHLEKGHAYFAQKDFKKALEAFKMAATVSNTDPDAYYWMARSFEADGDKVQAKENYERTLSLDPRFEEARQRLKVL